MSPPADDASPPADDASPPADDAGFARDFSGLTDRVWLNCAHQGPLPDVAAAAAHEAVAWKRAPHRLTTERFSGVPARLRAALARLLGAPAGEVSLANSASYGLHLLANGLPLAPGDEVLLTSGDFPSNLLPWRGLAARGVVVREVTPEADVLRPDELERALGPRTRVVCLSWVHSFSGRVADLGELGRRCRARGAALVVNAAQAVGARPIDVSRLPVDAVVGVGFKWLCGPYGTGYVWMRAGLRETLRVNRSYWLTMQTAAELAHEGPPPAVTAAPDARRYDVFGTANFLNFHTWTASLDYLLGVGIERIAAHDRMLVDRLLAGLDRARWRLRAGENEARSTLVFLSDHDPAANPAHHRALADAGFDVALRRGWLRVAPHLYNTPAEIDALLERLG